MCWVNTKIKLKGLVDSASSSEFPYLNIMQQQTMYQSYMLVPFGHGHP